MSSSPITLFSHAGGPNGWKVAIVMEELGLKYEPKYLDFGKGEHKAEEHTKYNPNGRIPTIIDGQTTLWESGAILLYLTDKYDKEHKISAKDDEERALINQWLFFQASGQGPYYGQAAHFGVFAPEKIPYAINRYEAEIKRVLSVLESVLSKSAWLVGGRCTIADLAFIPWNGAIGQFLLTDKDNFNFEKEFPKTFAWHGKMQQRASVEKINKDRAAVNSH